MTGFLGIRYKMHNSSGLIKFLEMIQIMSSEPYVELNEKLMGFIVATCRFRTAIWHVSSY